MSEPTTVSFCNLLSENTSSCAFRLQQSCMSAAEEEALCGRVELHLQQQGKVASNKHISVITFNYGEWSKTFWTPVFPTYFEIIATFSLLENVFLLFVTNWVLWVLGFLLSNNFIRNLNWAESNYRWQRQQFSPFVKWRRGKAGKDTNWSHSKHHRGNQWAADAGRLDVFILQQEVGDWALQLEKSWKQLL